jgi:2-dehydro-3-deoxygalactonokinase
MADKTALIGVDWGSSSVRAFRIAAGGTILDTRRARDGVFTGQGAYEARLRTLLGDWLTRDVPILLCGMIGSDRGWLPAPYIAAPTSFADLKPIRAPFDRPAFIVPGVSFTDGEICEVMRGEETLLAGLEETDVTVCLPGTHSKWAQIEGGRLTRFRTYMTGELRAAVLANGALATGVEQVASPDAFAQGLRAAADGATRALFQARARRLLGQLKPEHTAAFVDGVLIGAEIAQEPAQTVTLIASGAIAAQYGAALADRACTVDPETLAARGLLRIARGAGLL